MVTDPDNLVARQFRLLGRQRPRPLIHRRMRNDMRRPMLNHVNRDIVILCQGLNLDFPSPIAALFDALAVLSVTLGGHHPVVRRAGHVFAVDTGDKGHECVCVIVEIVGGGVARCMVGRVAGEAEDVELVGNGGVHAVSVGFDLRGGGEHGKKG